MYLYQNEDTGYWTEFANGARLGNVHNPALCADRGCAIHDHPSVHRLMDAPLNWREDRGILERICEHMVGHPDHDAAIYQHSIGNGWANIHGCDFCCTDYAEMAMHDE